MMRSVGLALAALLWTASPANGQFSCTLSANDENSCINTKGDDGQHCAWCAVSSFGFCVSESQAESMESNIPGVQCDRYSSTDDDAAATDDATPKNDDAAPKPDDDELPPDYWICLKKKDSTSCTAGGCTWCDSKGGFGLCLTGPSAEMAKDSDWFTCSDDNEMTETLEDPYDTSCVMSYLQNPTQQGCTSTMDEEGSACLWCDLQGMANVCLSQEQADMASALGITCDASAHAATNLRGIASPSDPYDTSCLLAYIQDPTDSGCTSAVDEDGQACEFCTLQGSYNLCLTEEQAEMGEQFGITCDDNVAAAFSDPYDPSCALAYLEDQSEDACKRAVDSDGNPCEYCTLQGAMNFCLNEEQAEMGEQFGLECDEDVAVTSSSLADPYDPTCALAYLQDQSEDVCKGTVDSDGNPCEYCTLQGAIQLCLNAEQAEVGEQLGIECDSASSVAVSEPLQFPSDFWDCLENYEEDGCAANSCTWCTTEVGVAFCVADPVADAMQECNFFDCNYKTKPQPVQMPFDAACLQGMQSQEACQATLDTSGGHCVWCDGAGVFGLCLSAEGAQASSDYLTCDVSRVA